MNDFIASELKSFWVLSISFDKVTYIFAKSYLNHFQYIDTYLISLYKPIEMNAKKLNVF